MSVHADPPPATVSEPNGFHYATGPQLGKGGFAICHRAEVLQDNMPTGRIVALKIVKSKMEPAKLAQKVCEAHKMADGRADASHSLSRNSNSIRSYTIQTSSNSTARSPSRPAHMSYWKYVTTGRSQTL